MASKPKPSKSGPFGALARRPHLVGAVVCGAVAAAALTFVPNDFRISTRAILAWDAACLWFIATSFFSMANRKSADIQARAATQDDGRHIILALVLTVAAASLAAIAMELHLAKADEGLVKAMRVILAAGTVTASWLVVQLVFALHYAHEYYASQDGASRDGKIRGGLGFPKDEAPDYWDFLHFATVIGVAAQTADVTFTSKTLRRIGTVHGIVAFTFNTTVLALTINLLAELL